MTQEMEMQVPPKAWEQRPTETTKQYAAFQVYYKLIPYGQGDEKRSLQNVARKLGLSSLTRLGEWSSEHDWVKRAIAYDAAMSIASITIQEADLQSYQQKVIDSLNTQLILLNKIIEETSKKIYENTVAGEIDLNATKKLAETIRIKDDLARRVGRMPTQFMTEKSEEEPPEETIYLMEG